MTDPVVLDTEFVLRGHVAQIAHDADSNWYWQWRAGIGHWGPFATREECLDHMEEWRNDQ